MSYNVMIELSFENKPTDEDVKQYLEDLITDESLDYTIDEE